MINFNKAYNRADYIDFLRNTLLPEDFTLVNDDRDLLAQRSYTYKRLTKAIKLGECKSLDLAVYEMQHDSDNDPRISLTNEAFKVIEIENHEFALIFFIKKDACQFRFSLIHCQTERDQANKVITKLSNPRRYSFILGQDAKVHTPTQYLIKSGRITDCDDLKKRFSIEVVNKEFYQDIQRMFYKLLGASYSDGRHTIQTKAELVLPVAENSTVKQEFGVRLIGRLVFCWFLRKKKSSNGIALIPEEILSSEAVKNNYYHKIIEPLFFQLLNTKIEDRRKEYQAAPYNTIPFLNGGLFDPNLHKDFYEIDENGLSLYQNTLKISDAWFSDFLKILETYNFTIDENTSIDIDLSVDPEMLGRIFENLLAEINPETGETARKSTGSFYTPREIVEYMVDESLAQYLITNTNINEEKIRNLLDYNIDQVPVSKIECEQVLTAIDELKVLDPACGSGAYPMGILQKLILVLQKVDPDSIQWVIMQLDKIPNLQVRKTAEEHLINENWRYKHKMGIIQNSIYGVDIQNIATEISKLRLFLTLIVDEKIEDDKNNRGIHPLPNLSFKFVTANTLIGLPENVQDSQATIFSLDSQLDPLMEKLEKLREKFFYANGDEKYAIEEDFRDTQNRISEIILTNKSDNQKAIALANWKPFGDESCYWFDKKLMFGNNDGFDIVIGNPPYIQLQKMAGSSIQQAYKEQRYDTFTATGDIYCLFYERGNQLLKNNGFLCYITSNKWMRAKYGEKLRTFFASKTQPVKLIDFGGYKVFESATVDTNIMIFQKRQASNHNLRACTIGHDFVNKLNLAKYFVENTVIINNVSKESLIISSQEEMRIKEKIERIGTPLKDWDVNIYRGILTGFNEAFIISGAKKDELIRQDPKSAEIIRPILRGRDIKRYRAEFADLWLICTFPSKRIDIENYPAVKNWLKTFGQRLEQTGNSYKDSTGRLIKCRKKTNNKWFETQDSIGYWEEFDRQKIIYPNMTKFLPFLYDEEKYVTNQKCFVLTGKHLEFLTIFLNSSLFKFCFLNNFPELQGGTRELSKVFFQEIPIIKITEHQNKIFKHKLLTLQTLISKNLCTKKINYQTDKLIFDLYGLSKDERDTIGFIEIK